MHYTLLTYESPASFALRGDPQKSPAYRAGWAAYTKTLQEAGILVAGAIQSAHTQGRQTGVTDWQAVALLYEGLVRYAPTTGALIGRAAAVAEAYGASAAWNLLAALPAEAVKNYQPYWDLAAHLLKRLDRWEEAANAYRRAIGLCEDPAMREFLVQQALHL